MSQKTVNVFVAIQMSIPVVDGVENDEVSEVIRVLDSINLAICSEVGYPTIFTGNIDSSNIVDHEE